MKRNILFLALAFCSCIVCAQPKENGCTPIREKRGFNQRIVIDKANLRVLYALNAKDIKDENTYIDLGKLEVGKNVRKYSSEFLAISDQKVKEWMKENKYNGPYPTMKWTLSQETATICEHKCQKATCHWRGRDFVAWFTTEIPIRKGPWKFVGLPGLILKVYDKNRFYTFEAIGIEKGNFPIYQYPQKMYGKSLRQKVWKLQGDLNRDFWKAIGTVNDQGALVSKPKPYEQLELE